MEKSGFYCPICKIVPLIQIVPKINEIKIFCMCKCTKKLIKYDIFMKNYFIKNINYENISDTPIYLENSDLTNNNEKIDLNKIKQNFLYIQEKLNKYILEIKTNAITMLENKKKEIEEHYEINRLKNIKLKNMVEILLKNYESNDKNDSNKKNLIYNTHFNMGYLNDTSKKFNLNNSYNFFSLDKYLQNAIDYFDSTNILSNYDENLNTIKKFYNHSSSVSCLIELSPERIISSSRDSFIVLYNLETKSVLYKFIAHQKGVNWIAKLNKNNIISSGEDSSIKIWPSLQLDYKPNNNGYMTVTSSDILLISPISSLNLGCIILKFVLLSDNLILACGKTKLFLIKYQIYDCESKEKLNYHMDIMKELDLKNNNFIDILNFKKTNNEEFIFFQGCKSINIISIPNLEIISVLNELNHNSSSNTLTQLNIDEILFTNDSIIKIYNINNSLIKYQYKISKKIICLSKLKDNTLLISTKEGIIRFSLNNFEEISLVEMIYTNFNSLYFQDYKPEKFIYIYEFKDGRLGICSTHGNIKICRFKLS